MMLLMDYVGPISDRLKDGARCGTKGLAPKQT
jgi:hypothetical protein